MEKQTVINIETVIEYIEEHLDTKLDLETIADAIHYSKYHLHRMFISTIGMTIHDYVVRRRLSEAAKLLVFSDREIIEIAFLCGYESQQAFTYSFKAMYKNTPAKYRENRVYYPLQLKMILHQKRVSKKFTIHDISLANIEDIPSWIELMHLVIDGYPSMDEEVYIQEITKCIQEHRALVLKSDGLLIGSMVYSKHSGSIDYLGIHPQYRNQNIQKIFLDALIKIYLPDQVISMTTYREGDKADTGYREMLKQLGFAERELLIEYGYPTQRFVLSPQTIKENKK